MAQDFERFEQSRLQRSLPPSCLFYKGLEQPALLGGRLLEEQLARPTCQAEHIDSLLDGSWCSLLDVLDLAQQTILLPAQGDSLLIEELLRNPSIELVPIHGSDARFDLVVSGPEPLDHLGPGRLLCPVGSEHGFPKPVKDGRWNEQLLQDVGELAGEDLLARVSLRAFSAIASAVVIHVLPLLQLTDKQAAAVTAVDQSCEAEIVFDLPRFVLGANIQ